MTAVRVLMLEDSDFDADLIVAHLASVGAEAITRVKGREDYLAALETGDFDIILSDFSLPGFDGARALDAARVAAPETPFIFVSGVLGEEFAIESLKKGATDYVLKQRLSKLPSAVARALAEARERIERRRAEDKQQMLVAELSHRVKNTLATVSSMARLTLQRSPSLEAFEDSFMSRLQALAAGHTLIFKANWGETELRTVLSTSLRAFRLEADDPIRVADGPPIGVPPRVALALTLMMHELATNAAKYGALSRAGGVVGIDWTVSGRGAFREVILLWRERGGPAVEPPTRSGFGRMLIERSARYELDGEADMSFRSDGLECSLRFPAVWPETA